MRPLVSALLLAPCLPAQPADLESRIRDALERARPVLLEQLDTADGGRLALLCLAAVHDDVPAEEPVFRKAITRLRYAELRDTYELSLRLMVMAEFPEYPNRDRQARSDVQRLLRNRFRGAFTYNPAQSQRWDLSNTQYGALGMRAAEMLGLRLRADIWRDLLRTVAAAQSPSGGFGYTPGNAPYASMTVAGIAVLQICRQYLGGRVPTSLDVDQRLQKAWQWMADHRADIGSPAARWSEYFHYGLERAAILSDVEQVGSVDWYRAGARMFVDRQLPGGGWGTAGQPRRQRGGAADPVPTAFAVLFLRRKFRKIPIPITPGGGLGLAALDQSSGEDDIRRVVERELVRGKASIPDMLRAMRSDVPARRMVAARVLYRITGEDFGFNPHREADHNRDAIRSAELWWLRNRDGRPEPPA